MLVKKAMRISAGKQNVSNPLTVVEGFKLIEEAIISGAKLEMCFIDSASTLTDHADLAERAILVPRSILQELATVKTAGHIVAYVTPPAESSDPEKILNNAKMLVVLDRIQDPGNLGTIMRTSEALGADAIILLKGGCHSHNAKTVRAAMGSSFRMPTLRLPDQKSTLELLRRHNFTCIATSMQGIPLPDFEFPEKCALFFGQEGQGLDAIFLKESTLTLAIPMHGQVESFNVATSVALCLYEWARRR